MVPRYGEVVDVNLVRDKGTGKSKGFAFLAYEDQRSTNLAVGSSLSLPYISRIITIGFLFFNFLFWLILGCWILLWCSYFSPPILDNLNGAQILGRIIRVDHVGKYKKKEEEDEETERQKRVARGVCRAFQRGECTRGASCKFSHDEQVSWAFYNDAAMHSILVLGFQDHVYSSAAYSFEFILKTLRFDVV